MARTDNDMWSPATGVGATATMVAAARAVATRSRLIHDPFAGALVRAAGVDFFIRIADGDLDIFDLGDDAGFARMTELFAVRTRLYDDFFAEAGRASARR